MIVQDFFNQLSSHFLAKLPFVAFRKPNSLEVKALLQKDAQLHSVIDFKESGFVFSPFDTNKQSVLFPLNQCDVISLEENFEDLDNDNNDTIDTEIDQKQQHIQLIQKGIKSIESGTLKKVVLSRVQIQEFDKDIVQLFKNLLASYTTAMVYCWYHPQVGLWLGATPETLLQVEGKRFKTMSLAGTQSFSNSAEVTWKTKELEEQQLVTDYIVSNLKSSVSSLNVGKLETVKAGNLLHLKTKISGLLNPENGLLSVINILHPTPAVCGLPKHTAKEFILKNEGYNREFYTGFLGEINIKQSKSRNTNRRNVENNAYTSIKTTSHLFVNLRCLQIKNNQAHIYVGGGITKDSVPVQEWEETVAKTKTVKNLL
ncbi:chorismate-binding protein [Olleya aquimaris]|uniref:Isochorismate synthase n=1 Tax=Olleya aquimaris TaxID=639310 RepID=A0A327RJG9_9FLAO|nr:chorismate-binding protein [Olleya aquimaris]RAJ16295.1 isochorismate synthase [Olleya aquimaris]